MRLATFWAHDLGIVVSHLFQEGGESLTATFAQHVRGFMAHAVALLGTDLGLPVGLFLPATKRGSSEKPSSPIGVSVAPITV